MANASRCPPSIAASMASIGSPRGPRWRSTNSVNGLVSSSPPSAGGSRSSGWRTKRVRLPITPGRSRRNTCSVRRLRHTDTSAFTHAARENRHFRSLTQNALDYALEGITTLEEVLRVTSDDEQLAMPGGAHTEAMTMDISPEGNIA